MKITFVGHSFHRVTQSSRFFIDVLEALGTVEFIWREPSSEFQEKSDDVACSLEADLVVVWQDIALATRLAGSVHPNVVFVPMYDGCKQLERADWRRIRRLKIINFSSELYQKLQKSGLTSSSYFQYFPDPSEFDVVSDFETLRGFFWQRRSEPNWTHVDRLMAGTPFGSFTLHLAVDSEDVEPVRPSASDVATKNVTITNWFPEKSDLLQKLKSANVYFAPRLDEGIGMSFLEAMAMGMVVCANDAPTHNEYIVDGINGFLFDIRQPVPCQWSRSAEMGRRARESVEKGFARWQADRNRLFEFLTTPTNRLQSRPYGRIYSASAASAAPTATAVVPKQVTGASLRRREGGRRVDRKGCGAAASPRITVATVVRNAPAELAATLASIVSQTAADKEVIVIDGASDEATLSVIDTFADRIDYWRSAPDSGPYDAMNKAADLARGCWIIFINAGDSFVDDGALERFVAGMPETADFVAGHHVYVSPEDGIENIHRCANFERTWERLVSGEVDGRWLAGIPGHQAVLTRVEMLRRHRYDLSYRIAADHEFMYRMRSLGASFHVVPVVVSRYVGGGLSARNMDECAAEWWSIAARYTRQTQKIAPFFRTVVFDALRRSAPPHPSWWRRRAFREHPALYARAAFERRGHELLERLTALRILRRRREITLDEWSLGLFCEDWYGLSHYESWGRWSDGKAVSFQLRQPLCGRTTVIVRCSSAVPTFRGRRVELEVGGQTFPVTVTDDTPILKAKLHLPTPVWQIDIHIPEPVRPKDIGLSKDTRALGICIGKITILSEA